MSGAPAPANARCPVCQHETSSSRCDGCGAALRPGGFTVERLLHRSARGRLYVARAEDGTRVAVKELVFASVPSVEEIEGFEREARTLQQLAHPRIPRLVRYFEEGRGPNLRFYLVQTFIEGPSLLESLSSRHYSEADALGVAREVLAILRYLHGLSPRVLHRDLKPANLIQREDGLFLVDFDCARELGSGATHRATLVGTFGYAPPEQLGGTVDASSDLYALGATLVHLLSRKAPAELLGPGMRLQFEDAVNVSPRTKAFLARLVDGDPGKRFRSAEDALAALDAPRTHATELRWERARSPAKTMAMAAIATVLACLAVLVAVGDPSSAPSLPPGSTTSGSTGGPSASSSAAASLALDHLFASNGLDVAPVSIARGAATVELRFELRARSPHTARVAWWGLGQLWLQYSTLLSSRPECTRCDTVQPARARFTFPDGRTLDAHRMGELSSYFMIEDADATPELVLTADVTFEVEAARLPLAVRFLDGHVVLLPWE